MNPTVALLISMVGAPIRSASATARVVPSKWAKTIRKSTTASARIGLFFGSCPRFRSPFATFGATGLRLAGGPNPFGLRRIRGVRQPIEQAPGVLVGDHQRAAGWLEKPVRHGAVELGQQRIVEAQDVEQASPLAMEPELRPGHHFAEFLDGAEAAGQ